MATADKLQKLQPHQIAVEKSSHFRSHPPAQHLSRLVDERFAAYESHPIHDTRRADLITEVFNIIHAKGYVFVRWNDKTGEWERDKQQREHVKRRFSNRITNSRRKEQNAAPPMAPPPAPAAPNPAPAHGASPGPHLYHGGTPMNGPGYYMIPTYVMVTGHPSFSSSGLYPPVPPSQANNGIHAPYSNVPANSFGYFPAPHGYNPAFPSGVAYPSYHNMQANNYGNFPTPHDYSAMHPNGVQYPSNPYAPPAPGHNTMSVPFPSGLDMTATGDRNEEPMRGFAGAAASGAQPLESVDEADLRRVSAGFDDEGTALPAFNDTRDKNVQPASTQQLQAVIEQLRADLETERARSHAIAATYAMPASAGQLASTGWTTTSSLTASGMTPTTNNSVDQTRTENTLKFSAPTLAGTINPSASDDGRFESEGGDNDPQDGGLFDFDDNSDTASIRAFSRTFPAEKQHSPYESTQSSTAKPTAMAEIDIQTTKKQAAEQRTNTGGNARPASPRIDATINPIDESATRTSTAALDTNSSSFDLPELDTDLLLADNEPGDTVGLEDQPSDTAGFKDEISDEKSYSAGLENAGVLPPTHNVHSLLSSAESHAPIDLDAVLSPSTKSQTDGKVGDPELLIGKQSQVLTGNNSSKMKAVETAAAVAAADIMSDPLKSLSLQHQDDNFCVKSDDTKPIASTV
jgi:hypothetical protein